MFELENNEKYLNICKEVMMKAWENFYNDKHNLLQKNNYRNNDLFVQPIDISDNNLPNGNSMYLLVCNKLKNITLENTWQKRIDILSKTFHSYINFNFSQMFSFIKILDICEKNITITFNGDFKKYRKILQNIDINHLSTSTILHKANSKDFFVVICKDQTCSKKLNNFEEIENYLKNINNV